MHLALQPHLTMDAYTVLTDLLNPAAQFLSLVEPSKLAPSRAFMAASGFPCTYELVALKTFFSKSERFKGRVTDTLLICISVGGAYLLLMFFYEPFVGLDSVPGSQLGLVIRRFMPGCGSTGFSKENCSVFENSVVSYLPAIALSCGEKLAKQLMNLRI